MDEDFIVLTPSRTNDPRGSKLNGALCAHIALGQARARRLAVVYLLVALGAIVWVSAAWPGSIPPTFRRFALTSWAVAAIGLLVAIAAEVRWVRRRAHFMIGLEQDPAAVTSRRDGRPPPALGL